MIGSRISSTLSEGGSFAGLSTGMTVPSVCCTSYTTVGALLTGVFAAPSLGGSGIWDYVANKASADYSIWGQVVTQGTGVLTTIVVSGVVSLIAFKLVDLTIGLRVPEEAEREGLDTTSHGEAAYRM